MTKTRDDYTILGRVIGSASGWDMNDVSTIILHDFQPREGLALPAGDVTVSLESGLASSWDDSGNIIAEVDIVAALSGTPIDK